MADPDETKPLLPVPITSSGSGESRRWWQQPVGSILMSICLESFGRYCILSNLVLFLDYWLQLSSEKAAMTALGVIGAGYFLAVVAGVFADARLGRFKMYRLALILQLFGSLFLLAAALCADYVHLPADGSLAEWIVAVALLGLVLFSLGMACSYSSAIPLGVDQYRMGGGGVSAAAGFFPRYYWGLNVGSLLSYTGISFLEINEGFQYGFIGSCVGYSLALVCLQSGRKRLQLMPPLGSPLRTVWEVLREAVWPSRGDASSSGDVIPDMVDPHAAAQSSRIPLSSENHHAGTFSLSVAGSSRRGLLGRAKQSAGGRCVDWKVDEVRMLFRLSAVLLTLTVYLTAYSQVCNTMRLNYRAEKSEKSWQPNNTTLP